jgi:hypothetical protein
MRDEMEWKTVKNPRKPNGDLGDLKCDFCGCQSGAYLLIYAINRICKGCLLDGEKAINKAILSDLK